MIEVFSTFYRLINHHRQVNKGDGIEQNNQPIGADCRMNGKEKQKSNDTSGFQHIKRSKHLLSSVNGNIRLAAKTKINS